MAKVWIDALTPKQVNFATALAEELGARGLKVFTTARRQREVEALLAIRGLKANVVGSYGGGVLKEKLRESAKRTLELIGVVEDDPPHIALSFGSPEAARVAFGLSIPHFLICDSPHAEAVCRLTIPLSVKLCTPAIIPLSAWRRYGFKIPQVVRYRAIDPIAWIRRLKPSGDARLKLGVGPDEPLVVIRPEEEQASYLLSSRTPPQGLMYSIIKELLERLPQARIAILPRYEDQAHRFAQDFMYRTIVVREPLDGLSLLQAANFFIGGGGTMTAEAALLGVPTVSCFPSKPTYVEKFLIARGLIKRSLNPKLIVKEVAKAVNDKGLAVRLKKNALRLANSMEDPVGVIVKHVTAYLHGTDRPMNGLIREP